MEKRTRKTLRNNLLLQTLIPPSLMTPMMGKRPKTAFLPQNRRTSLTLSGLNTIIPDTSAVPNGDPSATTAGQLKDPPKPPFHRSPTPLKLKISPHIGTPTSGSSTLSTSPTRTTATTEESRPKDPIALRTDAILASFNTQFERLTAMVKGNNESIGHQLMTMDRRHREQMNALQAEQVAIAEQAYQDSERREHLEQEAFARARAANSERTATFDVHASSQPHFHGRSHTSVPPPPQMGSPPPVGYHRPTIAEMREDISDLSHRMWNSQGTRAPPSPQGPAPTKLPERSSSSQTPNGSTHTALPERSSLSQTPNDSTFYAANNTQYRVFNSSRYPQTQAPLMGQQRVGQSFRESGSNERTFNQRSYFQISERSRILRGDDPAAEGKYQSYDAVPRYIRWYHQRNRTLYTIAES